MVENSRIEMSNNRMVNLQEADSVTLKNSTFSTGQQGFQVYKISKFVIQDSTFSNFSSETHKGGAILSEDSNLTVTDSTFTENKAVKGGALNLDCMFDCSFSLTGVTFSNNEALVQGGAISYSKQRPEMSMVTFSDNKAEYGPDIGSYTVSYRMKSKSDLAFSNVGSGAKTSPFTLELLDFDGNVVTVQNKSLLTLKAGMGYDLLGQSIAAVHNGEANFNGVIFIGDPGAKNVPFKIENSDVSKTYLGTILG